MEITFPTNVFYTNPLFWTRTDVTLDDVLAAFYQTESQIAWLYSHWLWVQMYLLGVCRLH